MTILSFLYNYKYLFSFNNVELDYFAIANTSHSFGRVVALDGRLERKLENK